MIRRCRYCGKELSLVEFEGDLGRFTCGYCDRDIVIDVNKKGLTKKELIKEESKKLANQIDEKILEEIEKERIKNDTKIKEKKEFLRWLDENYDLFDDLYCEAENIWKKKRNKLIDEIKELESVV